MKPQTAKRIKTEFQTTDVLKAELVIMDVQYQVGKIIRITDSEGKRTAIAMDVQAMLRLQKYINKAYPIKEKKSKLTTARKAVKKKKACDMKAERFNTIAVAVCREMILVPAAVMGGRRFRELSDARKIITYLARKYVDMSYPEIADMFGEKCHSSPLFRMTGLKKYEHTRKCNGRSLHEIKRAVEKKLELK